MTLTRLAAVAALAALLSPPSPISLAAEVIDLTPPRLQNPDLPPVGEPKEPGKDESGASGTTPKPKQEASSGGSSSDAYGVDAQPMLQTRHFGAQVELACAVANTPNDLVLVNRSSQPLPPGTKIKWQIKSAGLVGYFAIIGQLDAGQTLVADDVVAGTPDASAACVARAI